MINERIIVDAGMSINYFDAEIIRRAMRPEAANVERPTSNIERRRDDEQKGRT